MEAYDVNQSNSEEKTDNDKTDQSFDDSTNRTVDHPNPFPSQNYSGQEQKFEYVMSNEERLLIAQHMRQHIQLLTQMSLLTAKGQLISKCRFGVKTSFKKPTIFFPGFLPLPLKRGQVKKIV